MVNLFLSAFSFHLCLCLVFFVYWTWSAAGVPYRQEIDDSILKPTRIRVDDGRTRAHAKIFEEKNVNRSGLIDWYMRSTTLANVQKSINHKSIFHRTNNAYWKTQMAHTYVVCVSSYSSFRNSIVKLKLNSIFTTNYSVVFVFLAACVLRTQRFDRFQWTFTKITVCCALSTTILYTY